MTARPARLDGHRGVDLNSNPFELVGGVISAQRIGNADCYAAAVIASSDNLSATFFRR